MKQDGCFCDLCNCTLNDGQPSIWERVGFGVLPAKGGLRLTSRLCDTSKHICDQCLRDITSYGNQFAVKEMEAVTRTGTERER